MLILFLLPIQQFSFCPTVQSVDGKFAIFC